MQIFAINRVPHVAAFLVVDCFGDLFITTFEADPATPFVEHYNDTRVFPFDTLLAAQAFVECTDYAL